MHPLNLLAHMVHHLQRFMGICAKKSILAATLLCKPVGLGEMDLELNYFVLVSSISMV